MKASGYLVASIAEFSSGMKDRKHNLHRRKPRLFLYIHGYSPPVIHNGDRIVRIDSDLYGITISGQCLIHRVVNDLVYQMMKAAGRCTAYIHARPLSNSLKPLQNLNLICSVLFSHILYHPFIHSHISLFVPPL